MVEEPEGNPYLRNPDLDFKDLDEMSDNFQWQDGAGLAFEWLLHAGIMAMEKTTGGLIRRKLLNCNWKNAREAR